MNPVFHLSQMDNKQKELEILAKQTLNKQSGKIKLDDIGELKRQMRKNAQFIEANLHFPPTDEESMIHSDSNYSSPKNQLNVQNREQILQFKK